VRQQQDDSNSLSYLPFEGLEEDNYTYNN